MIGIRNIDRKDKLQEKIFLKVASLLALSVAVNLKPSVKIDISIFLVSLYPMLKLITYKVSEKIKATTKTTTTQPNTSTQGSSVSCCTPAQLGEIILIIIQLLIVEDRDGNRTTYIFMNTNKYKMMAHKVDIYFFTFYLLATFQKVTIIKILWILLH